MRGTVRSALCVVTILGIAASGCGTGSLNPGMYEPTPTESPPTEVITPTLDPVAADCARLQLTPEECANFGTHQYQMSGQYLDAAPSRMYFCDEGNGATTFSETATVTMVFGDDDSLDVQGMIVWQEHSDRHFPRISGNAFERQSTVTSPAGEHAIKSDTVTLSALGFVHDERIKSDREPPIDCTRHEVYMLAGPLPSATHIALGQIEATEPPKAAPQSPEKDFSFRLERGACFTDVLDTFEGSFTKDLIFDPSITIPFRLSSGQMQNVYAKMMEIDFFGYPEVFAIPTPTSGPMTLQMPAENYHILVKSGGTTKTLAARRGAAEGAESPLLIQPQSGCPWALARGFVPGRAPGIYDGGRCPAASWR